MKSLVLTEEERMRPLPRTSAPKADESAGRGQSGDFALQVPVAVRYAILKHAWHALPNECVGMLAARDSDISRVGVVAPIVGVAPCHNHAPDRRLQFRVDPHEQYAVEVAFLKQAWTCTGTYHSHPAKAPEPSGSDCEAMGTRLMLIVHPTRAHVLRDGEPMFGGDVRCWRAVDGHTQEVPLEWIP